MRVTHLSLAYGTKVIYDDCNFHTEVGDKVGIVGVNGAGKTTLFRIIRGEKKPDDGEIILENQRLGYLPQEIIIPEEDEDITAWNYIAEGRPIDKLQDRLNIEYEKLAKFPDSKAIMDRISALQDQIDSFDIANFDHDLLRVVDKMHLGSIIDQKMRDLSGGQKSKVAFAKVLFENADILMLDEPTNHLDAETEGFITNFLKNYHGTVLVISHDVKFLDAVTNKTLFVNKNTHKIKLYRGNYTNFRREYAAEKTAADVRISEQEREIKRLSEFVERAKNAKKANHALHSRGKSAEKSLMKKLSNLETREAEYSRVAMNLSPAKQSGRTPLEIQNLVFHYDGSPEIYHGLSFSIDRGEKFLIVGENGAGKSTLLKLIVGQLNPDSGSIIMSQNTTVAYYAQEFEILDERRTILENVTSYDFTDTELRGILSNFLFFGDDIFKKVSILSPGEKARVALCKTMLKRANLVILDEPTNHFDPETQKIIGENLKDYAGTIVMVSHNPSFVEQIGITRMLIVPPHGSENTQVLIKNYSRELLEYYYYLNEDLI